MGRKPSMFSKNYRKELKKRRIRQYAIVGFFIFILGGTLIVYKSLDIDFKGYFSANKSTVVNGNIDDDKNESELIQDEKEDTTTIETEEKEVVAKLNSSENILIKLSGENDSIMSVEGSEEIKSVISSTKTKGVILDSSTQDIYLIDNIGNMKCITNPQYISTYNEAFTKESVLQYNPTYKWVEDVGFIDENHIAYTSQLPWIGEGNKKYLWIFNIDNNTHIACYDIYGETMKIGDFTADGIEVKQDEKNIIVDYNGKIVK